MPSKNGVNVRPHTRAGKPVSGYTRHQTWSQRTGAVLAGHQPGSVKKAAFAAVGISFGSALFALLHIVMTTAEVVIVMTVVGFALFGAKTAVRWLRRRRRLMNRKKPVTFSLKARKHHMLAKIRKMSLPNSYRGWLTQVRKNYPMASGVYDGWFGKHQVTVITGRGKGKKAETFTIRGSHRAKIFESQKKEELRQQGVTARVSMLQIFR